MRRGYVRLTNGLNIFVQSWFNPVGLESDCHYFTRLYLSPIVAEL